MPYLWSYQARVKAKERNNTWAKREWKGSTYNGNGAGSTHVLCTT
jgi:hypothetical protein